MFEKRPRIGFYLSDGLLEPVPAAKRAVTEAISRLEAAGYEVVGHLSPPPFWDIFDLFNGFILADEGAGLAVSLGEDVTDVSLRGLLYGLMLYRLPSPLRKKSWSIYVICNFFQGCRSRSEPGFLAGVGAEIFTRLRLLLLIYST